MALDRELVGRSYPPSAVYEVGRAKIAEFATAIGDDSPVYRDAEAARAAGHPDVIAPPTFAIAVSLEAAMVVVATRRSPARIGRWWVNRCSPWTTRL